MAKFVVKRIYEPAARSDGYRVLVDRLWPRGVSKERADLDEWAKDIAPSSQLRKWFGHDPSKFIEFTERYETELKNNPKTKTYIADWQTHDIVTLLYAARDKTHNEAVALQKFLSSK